MSTKRRMTTMAAAVVFAAGLTTMAGAMDDTARAHQQTQTQVQTQRDQTVGAQPGQLGQDGAATHDQQMHTQDQRGVGMDGTVHQEQMQRETVHVNVNDEQMNFRDVQPHVYNDNVYVPVRDILESMGFEVHWVHEDKRVVATNGNERFELWVNRNEARMNDQNVQLDGDARIVQARTLVPLDFLSANFDLQVNWERDQQVVTIQTEREFTMREWAATRDTMTRDQAQHDEWRDDAWHENRDAWDGREMQTQPGMTQPAQPGIAQPPTTAPDAERTGAGQTGLNQQGDRTAPPGQGHFGSGQPDADFPADAQPQQYGGQPGAAQPGATQPGAAQLGTGQPGTAHGGGSGELRTGQDGVGHPGATTPGIHGEATHPGATTPGIHSQPGRPGVGVGQPGATEPGVPQTGHPGAGGVNEQQTNFEQRTQVEQQERIGANGWVLADDEQVYGERTRQQDRMIRVQYNDQFVTFDDAQPRMFDNRVFVPLRGVFERMDADVNWVAEERKVEATRDNKRVELWIGRNWANVDGQRVNLDAAPRLVEGRTLVPLRFLSETLGAEVDWQADQGVVVIRHGDNGQDNQFNPQMERQQQPR